MQVNCRNILNNSLDFWNVIDSYDLNGAIGTESWLREETSKDDCRACRRDRNTSGDGVFICAKKEKYIVSVEFWVEEDFEMIALDMRG
jgi:hypothetical protein